MPWDLRLERRDGEPLGDLELVQQVIENACPGVEFYREPSGAEKLAAINHLEVPDVIRQSLQRMPARIQGDFEGKDFSLRFYLGDEGVEIVNGVDVEARGTTQHALALLNRLASLAGWVALEGAKIIVDPARASEYD